MNDAPGRTGLESPRTAPDDRVAPVDTTGRRAAPDHNGEVARVARTVVETARRPHFNRRRATLLAAAVVGVIVLIAGLVYWRANAGLVKTDNAQTAGDLAPVSSKETGTVIRVDVQENQHVTAGTPLVELDPQDFDCHLQLAHALRAQDRHPEAEAGDVLGR